MQPAYGNISAPAIAITADIVINGETVTGKEGNSDPRVWNPNPLVGWTYGASYPSRSVTIRGGCH
jgi:hypothetical protein